MKTLLFTGASGFLGNNLKDLLSKKYLITTIGMTVKDNIKIDLSASSPDIIDKFDVVLHAAGKAHTIPKTEKEKKSFFDVNYQGTVNLCASLEKSQLPKAFIFVSSVAVYGLDFGENINENTLLAGKTPYALSKIQAEEFLKQWCNKNKVILSIIRPSLIAGKNPPGNLGSMINGIKTGKYLRIGNGSARKSILMAEDIARVIPRLAEVGGIYNVCDNHHPSFAELEELIAKQLNKKAPNSIPYLAAKSLALVGDCIGNKFPINSSKLDKITQSLTFSNEKAKRELNWEPLDVLRNFRIS
jgi:nucleoside-diphosphate-sugar epimerase